MLGKLTHLLPLWGTNNSDTAGTNRLVFSTAEPDPFEAFLGLTNPSPVPSKPLSEPGLPTSEDHSDTSWQSIFGPLF